MEYYIGFDIGGTKCAAILGSREKDVLRILGRRSFPTAACGDPEETVRRLAAAGEELLRARGLSLACLSGTGVSCGNPLDSRNGVILGPPNLPFWKNVEITKMLQEYFHAPSRLQNDANAGALAEWQFGAAKGKKNVIFNTFGTGCGAGLILDGRLYTGMCDNAGECGHIRLSPFGPAGYGKTGSMEGFCSGGGLAELGVQTGRAFLQTGRETALAPYLREGGVTAQVLARLARGGDEASLAAFEESGRQLGRGLAILIDLLNPQIIVIGSIFARCRDLLWRYAKEEIDRECLPSSAAACEVVPAALGEEIGDYAALTAAFYDPEDSLRPAGAL